MIESWVGSPMPLPSRCKFRIFKSRSSVVENPWILVLPATPHIKSRRTAIGYREWEDAYQALSLILSFSRSGD